MKHYKHYLVQVQNTFPLKVYGPNNCMVLGPLPPHPHIPNPFCALLAGWGLAGSGQQSKLSRLRSSPNFKCTLRPHPFAFCSGFGGSGRQDEDEDEDEDEDGKSKSENNGMASLRFQQEWLVLWEEAFHLLQISPARCIVPPSLSLQPAQPIEAFTLLLQESACSLVANWSQI